MNYKGDYIILIYVNESILMFKNNVCTHDNIINNEKRC
nr:MAG TPA: hypothetical protein [Caudoviricetes sp.]